MEIIYSSAGSGKTQTLAMRFLEKVLQGEKSENIYCLTFTKKATIEIKERIIFLSEKIIDGDKDLLSIFNLKKISKQIITELSDLKIKDLKISTIDSFLYRMLQFIDMDTKKLISEEELFMIVEQAKFNFSLNNNNNRENFEEMVVILKNMYISKRSAMVKLLEENNSNSLFEIYSYKQFNKENLEKKIKDRLATIDNYDAQKLSKSKDVINDFLKSEFVNVYKSLNYNFLKNIKKEDKEYLKSILIYIKAYLFIEDSNMTMKELFENFKKFEEEIEKLKIVKKGIDYNDILIQLNKLLKEEDNKLTFEYYIFNNIGHILVDEYQDTSSLQDNILSIIFKELSNGSNNVSDKPTIFLVGDIKQSIYEWRDADSNLFINHAQRLKKESYRFFDDNKLIEEKIYESKIIENTNIHRIETNNYTRRIHPNLMNSINEKFKNSGLIGFKEHTSKREDQETNYTFDEFDFSDDELIENTIEIVKGFINSGKQYKDICILTRNNNILNILEHQLKQNEINGKFSFPIKKDNGGLTSSFEVEFINNLILSVLAVDNSLYFKRFVEKIIENQEDVFNHFSHINYSEDILYFETKIKELNIQNLSLEDKILKIINEFDVFSYMLKIRKIASINVMNRYIEYILSLIPFIRNENELIDRIVNIHNNKNLNLDINEDINAVHLLTVHKSKGLEFDTVVLIEKEIFKEEIKGINILPNGKILNFGKNKTLQPFGFKEFDEKVEYFKKEERQNQLRLAYVAHTRAKNNLIVIK